MAKEKSYTPKNQNNSDHVPAAQANTGSKASAKKAGKIKSSRPEHEAQQRMAGEAKSSADANASARKIEDELLTQEQEQAYLAKSAEYEDEEAAYQFILHFIEEVQANPDLWRDQDILAELQAELSAKFSLKSSENRSTEEKEEESETSFSEDGEKEELTATEAEEDEQGLGITIGNEKEENKKGDNDVPAQAEKKTASSSGGGGSGKKVKDEFIYSLTSNYQLSILNAKNKFACMLDILELLKKSEDQRIGFAQWSETEGKSDTDHREQFQLSLAGTLTSELTVSFSLSDGTYFCIKVKNGGIDSATPKKL